MEVEEEEEEAEAEEMGRVVKRGKRANPWEKAKVFHLFFFDCFFVLFFF